MVLEFGELGDIRGWTDICIDDKSATAISRQPCEAECTACSSAIFSNYHITSVS